MTSAGRALGLTDVPDEHLPLNEVNLIEESAEMLYGLVHQRFILTRPGLDQMDDKYTACHFGACPRYLCNSAYVVPCGSSDLLGADTVKLFCPNCLDIYT